MQVTRILAVNLNYLGDTLFTTAALDALRVRFPEATIDVQVNEQTAPILEGHPAIDNLILRPRDRGARRRLALWEILSANKYDAIVLFQTTPAYAILAALARIPLRIGFNLPGCGAFLTHALPPQQHDEHWVDTYLRLAQAGDYALPSSFTPRLSLQISPDEEAFARQFLAHNLQQGNPPPRIGLVTGATRPQKQWPEAHFIRLIEKLWHQQGVSCVLLGGQEEAEKAERIARQVSAPVLVASGKTSIKELSAILDQLDVVVSADTGPIHLATARDTPVIALFGSTRPQETGPWTSPHGTQKAPVVLWNALPCAPCYRKPTCDGRFDCMTMITPERVYDALQPFLPNPLRRRFALPLLPPLPKAEGENILVITKHRFLGDTIVSVPLLRALRRHYPHASITLLTGGGAATALQNLPYVNRVHTYEPGSATRNRSGSLKLFRSFFALSLAVRKENKPDMILLADRSFRAGFMAWLMGGRVRAGFDTERRRLFLTHPLPWNEDKRESDCYLDILRMIEQTPHATFDLAPELTLTDEEYKDAQRFLPSTTIPIIGLQPGASHDYKRWDLKNFIAVADQLQQYGCQIVLLGGPEEEEMALQMATQMQTPPLNLTGKTKLRETMSVLANLALFIGNDTGVTHLAAGVGTPTIALFGPTPAHKWGNSGAKHRVLNAVGGDMNEISPEAVLLFAKELLGEYEL
jgi:heptosyltransferase I